MKYVRLLIPTLALVLLCSCAGEKDDGPAPDISIDGTVADLPEPELDVAEPPVDAPTVDAPTVDAPTVDAPTVDDTVKDASPDTEPADIVEHTAQSLAQHCIESPDDALCRAPGETCGAPDPMLAFAWSRPSHWAAGTPPEGSTLSQPPQVAINQGGDLDCDWLNDNAGVGCNGAVESAKNLDALAALLGPYPNGRRAIIWRAYSNETLLHWNAADTSFDLSGSPQPGIWWDQGVIETAQRATAIFEGLKERGVTLDAVYMDLEWGLGQWSIGTCSGDNEEAQELRWEAIVNDARFEAVSQILNNDFGFIINEEMEATSNVCPSQRCSAGQTPTHPCDRYLRWGALMQQRTAAYYHQAIAEPAEAVFPGIRVSNYGYDHASTEFEIPESNGHLPDSYSPGFIVGTHQAPFCYGAIGQLSDFKNVAISPDEKYERTPFSSFRYAINQCRSPILSAPDVPSTPWVGSYNNTCKNQKCPYGATPLWHEAILHIGLLNPDALLYFNPNSDPEHDAEFEPVLAELNRILGCADRTSRVTTLAEWFGPYVLSGVAVADRNVWRLTQDDKEISLERQGADLVATFSDRTLRFPNAWKDPATSTLDRGIWILQHINAGAPIVEMN
jgi:hypothetical protein